MYLFHRPKDRYGGIFCCWRDGAGRPWCLMFRDGAFAFVMIFGNIAQGLAYWRFSARFPSCNTGLHDRHQRAGIRSIVSLPSFHNRAYTWLISIMFCVLGLKNNISPHIAKCASYTYRAADSVNMQRFAVKVDKIQSFAGFELTPDIWHRGFPDLRLYHWVWTYMIIGNYHRPASVQVVHRAKILSGLFHIDYILEIWDVYMYQGGSSSYYHWASFSRPPFEGPLAFKWVSEDLDVDATFSKTYTLSDYTSRPTTLWYSDYHHRVIVFDCGTPCASLPVSDRPFLNTVPWWLGNNEQQMDNYTAAAGGGPRCMVLD